MIKLNIHEAKTNLSRYLERVMKGEVIILCRNNQPIAEIRSLWQPRKSKRRIGLDADTVTVSKGFFEPLPEKVLRGFLNPL